MKPWFQVAPTLVAVTLIASTVPALAGDAPPPRSNPSIVQRNDFGDGPNSLGPPLTITKLDVAVEILGGSARTVATVSFRAPWGGQSEGDFDLDLPAHSVITGYALDIDGKLVDGVLVSTRQGTQAFENRRRKSVDPGLAEVSRTGDFHVRVFPITNYAPRTIRLEFVTPIGPGADYVLPLKAALPLEAVSVTVKSADGIKPAVLKGPKGLELRWAGSAATARAQAAGVAGDLVIGSGQGSAPSLAFSRHQNGETFFDLTDPAEAAKRAAPKRVRIYWDVSRSRHDDDLTGETALLSRYVGATGAGAVELITFADTAPKFRRFSGPHAAEQLKATLSEVDYRGATSLAQVFQAKAAKADVCLLFTDGDATFDDYRGPSLDCPLYVVSSARDARRDVLGALASKSHGEAIDLSDIGLEAALDRLTSPRPRVIDVRTADGGSVAFTQLTATRGLHLVGPSPGAGDILVQVAGEAGARRYASLREEPVRHDGAGAMWASGHLADLAAADQAKDPALLAMARRYQVAAAGIVFVVLERPADYVQAEITPPVTLGAEPLAEYRKLLAEYRKDKAEAKRDRIRTIAAAWEAERTWWAQPARGPRPPSPPRALPGEYRPLYAPSPAPSPQPRKVAPFDPEEGTEVEEVIVTGTFLRGTPDYAVMPVSTTSESSRARSATAVAPVAVQIETELQPWSLDRPYLKALDAATPQTFKAVFRAQEDAFGKTPAFYFDVAEYLFQKGRREEALAMVVNAVEMPGADTTTLTVLADRMMRYGDPARAMWLYQKILRLEPDRPQPRRNLALALIQRAETKDVDPELAKADYERALGLLNEVIMRPWNGDYDGVELVALMEANRTLAKVRPLGPINVALNRRLIAPLDVDLRVVLEWNTDKTDMDLWVDEPGGERAIYSNPATYMGGRLSNDMTAGYGPEEYLLHHAANGAYEVRVNVYAIDRFDPNGATSVRARLYRNYGRVNETSETFEIELKPNDRDALLLGKFTVGKGGAKTPG